MDFDIFRILIVAAFLVALLAALFFVRRYSPTLKAELHKNRRVLLRETSHIAPHTKLVIVEVDGREFVTVIGKSGATSLMPLDTVDPQKESPSCV